MSCLLERAGDVDGWSGDGGKSSGILIIHTPQQACVVRNVKQVRMLREVALDCKQVRRAIRLEKRVK
jgi:hypothetical protein